MVVAYKNRCSIQVVHRNIKEALDLRRVQIHRQQAMRARNRNQIGYELRRDGNAWAILLVRAAITVIRNHRRDALG
jgi:hypothetical protein